MDPWWSSQTSTLIGAIGGSAAGVFGGVLGTLGGIFAPRGKFKALVLSLYAIAAAAGACLLLVGLIAIVSGQPFAVWYPLLLVGGLSAFIFGPLSLTIRNVYRQAEMRHLEAQELRRG